MNNNINGKYFESINQPANISYNMGNGVPGSYDGLVLRPKGGSTWRKPPSNVPLKKGKFFVPQGTPLPLKHEMQFMDLPKNSMFVWDKNVASPACCSATYSTSTGCVCTTKQQRDMIGQNRGNNKNYPNGSF
tara:strand:+ start:430 stop:825 length:396 start_codon:yes stop_codon:yes gene_type:complete